MISIPAKLFGLPWLPQENQRFRVAANGFEVLWISDGDSSFTATLDFNARVTLSEIERFATIIGWLGQGSVDVQVWGKGHRLIGGVLAADPGPPLRYDWPKVSDVTKTLKSLHAAVDSDGPRISIADINAGARDLYLMHEVTSATNICLEFFPLPDQSYDFITVLYYSVAEVGNVTAYALVERKLSHWSDGEAGRRRVEFGLPVLKESWVISDANETQRNMIADDFRHQLSQMKKTSKVLELGDIAVFVRSLQNEGLIQLPPPPP